MINPEGISMIEEGDREMKNSNIEGGWR